VSQSAEGSDAELEEWLVAGRQWAEGLLEQALVDLDLGPAEHAESLRYALLGGGKRLRPCLVRLACSELGGDDAAAAAPAVALECVHTYSLVHDDLPCMDDDDLRRGRPTTHKVYGEAAAVLAGDSLQAMAFEVLGRSGAPRAMQMVVALAAGAGPAGMVGGQSLDLLATGEGAGPLSADGVREIHRCKTGALIAAATELGALAAQAGEAEVRAMARYGAVLGALFQARDDVLDVTGDAAQLGKTPGKDAAADKATLVAALGLDGARAECAALVDRARDAAGEAGCRPGGLLQRLPNWLARRTY
jgi:farnesyl diphosphate synthase